MPPLARLHRHLSLSLIRRHSPCHTWPAAAAAEAFLRRGLASSSSSSAAAAAAAAAAGREKSSRRTLAYLLGVAAAMVGASYAAVPLYRRFCQATGYGGTVQRRESVEEKISRHAQDGTTTSREIIVQFNADVADGMPWKFIPTQREVKVKPGESALAFYTAENRSSAPITGVSTYNVAPMKAAIYFNKIQCFCFEEQTLLPGEQIDMPVFFYIDPEFETDPKMEGVNNIVLSYTFFKAAILFNKMVKDGFVPDQETFELLVPDMAFLSLLNMVSESLLKVVNIDGIMSPRIFNIIIYGLTKEGFKSEACKFLDRMIEKGWVPDSKTHSILLGSIGREELRVVDEVYQAVDDDNVSNILFEALD